MDFKVCQLTRKNDGTRAAITNSEGRIIMVRDGKGYKDSKGNFEYYFYDPRTKTPMGQYGNIPPGFRQRGKLADAPPFKDINFNQGFHSLDRFVPPPIPGMYTPPYRQTFNQIAEAVYGSKRYGDDLAVRNGGGSGSAVVYANDSIYLPAKNTMSYNSVQDTAIVAENSKIGSLNPNIPQLLPPVHHHIWVEILDAYFLLMAVVLDIVSGGSGTPFLVAMIEQVAVAVVTNLETQAVNMIGGVQHKFNGTSLALSAVEAAISAGASKLSQIQAGANMVNYNFGEQLAISESFEALRQVAAIGFGVQHHFNWAGFVASALGASTGGIMHKAHLSNAEGYALQTASAGVQVVIEGLGTKSHRVDPFTVGATMLGTAIGTAMTSPSPRTDTDINTTNKSANGNLSRSMPTTHQDESPLELAYDAGEQGPVDLKRLHTESTSPAVHQAKNDARLHGTYLDQVQQSEINAFRHLMWSHSQDIMTHRDAMSLDMLGARMSVGGSVAHSGIWHQMGQYIASHVEAHAVRPVERMISDEHATSFDQTLLGAGKELVNSAINTLDVLTGYSGIAPQVSVSPQQRFGADLVRAGLFVLPVGGAKVLGGFAEVRDAEGLFNSGGDRLLSSMRSGRISHPEEYNAIISDLRVNKVDISFRKNQFAYGPSSSVGHAGNIVIDPDASISALRHEYGHFLDDKALGYPGMRAYYENPELRVATERRSYLGEIRLAKFLGDQAARRLLVNDYLEEKANLIERFYTEPYGYNYMGAK